MINYKSIELPIVDRLDIKKSQFITYLYPIEDETSFNNHLVNIRKEHYKANHCCFAYLLGQDAQVQKMSDDGEPSGTAGIPMLEVLKRNELTYLMAVTVRYFGGIKLGASGLIRAYSSAVSHAIKQASIIMNVNQMMIQLSIHYNQINLFNHYIDHSPHDITIIDTQYTDTVTYKIAIFLADLEKVHQSLFNHFNGQIEWTEIGVSTINISYQL